MNQCWDPPRIKIAKAFLGLLLLMSFCLAAKAESRMMTKGDEQLLLTKVFHYADSLAEKVEGTQRFIYLKYDHKTVRRNFTLVTIPTMHTIAHGERNYTGETYGAITFNSLNDYDIESMYTVGTIAHQRKIMPIMMGYITPAIYSPTLLRGELLSPFHYDNRKFYNYLLTPIDSTKTRIAFRPRTINTQLVKGTATVNTKSGKVMEATFTGHYDLMVFQLKINMPVWSNSIIPDRCEVLSNFRFMGNHIASKIVARFNCTTAPPDSCTNAMELMAQLRPEPLSAIERKIYEQHAQQKQQKSDSTKSRNKQLINNKVTDRAWDIIGDYLLSSQHTGSERASLSMSPLFSPQYFSYSNNRGLAYKIKIGSIYNFNSNSNLSLCPQLGYNFKQKLFYFNSPLRYTFNSRRNGWIEYTWANGNRITNSSILDKIKDEQMDTIDFDALKLDYFKDEMLKLEGNLCIADKWNVSTGAIYHRRTAVNSYDMEALGKQSIYSSFAPFVSINYQPSPTWPIFSCNYERGIPHLFKSDIKYERVEMDMSYKRYLKTLRNINFRLGCGFFTNKSDDYFVDYSNFRENYLPDSWEDGWTGQFQLLNSTWYNASRYYMRSNISYESPMMFITRMPWIGRYIEKEKLFLSMLQIEHISTPYIETGYGITNQYFSMGLFANFINGKFFEFGTKFTLELFRKW